MKHLFSIKIKFAIKINIAILFLVSLIFPNSIFSKDLNYPKAEEKIELKEIFAKYGSKGSILIFDNSSNKYFGYNVKRAKVGFLPASTFKIANTLIGLELGLIDTNSVFKWDGKKRGMEAWEKDLNLRNAFQVSCVPCYQELARKIGVERMKRYLNEFHYGNIFVDNSNIDKFWLEGESKISQFEQVEFLKKIYFQKLPISKKNILKLKEIMLSDTINGYKLFCKTGWVVRQGQNIGWYVGFVEVKGKVYFFATNLELPKNKMKSKKDESEFLSDRKLLTLKSFEKMGIIKN